MSERSHISRRTFLRGAGVALALPWLESLAPRIAFAEPAPPPVRLAFLFVPNGKHMEDWTPLATGAQYDLPFLLEPLAPYRQRLLVLSGLAQDHAFAHGDGPGDHARAAAVFLTSSHAKKTSGADIHVGISVDQVAASALGKQTRFASLELGCDPGAQSGQCDSGYSCAYTSNISWRGPSTPSPKERNPRVIFERLFGDDGNVGTPAQRARRLRARRSILDFVGDDAQRLARRTGGSDGAKLDEYLTSVRELERRIERAEGKKDARDELGLEQPAGVPETNKEHIQLLGELMVLAFRTDTTRVASLMVANAGSNRSYPDLDVRDGHHALSHHGGEEAKQDKIRTINRYHVEQLAHLLGKLAAVPEGEGTLLDNTLLLYGSGIGDGNRHNHDELPILLAGGGGGAIHPGRHLRYEKGTPLANLFLCMLDAAGVPAKSLGDSTGRLPDL